MRFISLFRKTFLENLRDWKILILTLTFGPFFVVLMYFYFEGTAQTPYRVIVVNQDEGATTSDGDALAAGQGLISEMMNTRTSEGAKVLEVQQESDMDEAHNRLEDDSVDLVVEIPRQFSRALLDFTYGNQPTPTVVRTYGNPANANYLLAAVWSDMITYEYAAALTGLRSPLALETNHVGGAASLNEFDLYVPGLLTLALIMMMFTAAASLIKEKDKGTIIRLRLSNMTTLEWFSAVCLTQVILGLLIMALTYLTAVLLGYQSSGSLAGVMVVGLVSSLSIFAISLLVAAGLRTIFDLLTIGCFPFFILMFFSGGMFPLPPLRIFTVGNYAVSINDILPTTHTIAALHKILNLNARLGDVALELGAIAVLTAAYFCLGAWLFAKRHMRAQDK
jgi:ABC-2 type transport system permease protein